MAPIFQSHDITRLASGTLSISTLLGSSSYLVDNFTPTTDMLNTPIQWQAILEDITDPENVIAIDGSSGIHGYSNGVIRFAVLTSQMANVLLTTVLGGKYTNDVTLAGYHPTFETAYYNCKLTFPSNLEQAGEKLSAGVYANVRMDWFRGSILGNSWDLSFDSSFG